MQPEIEKCLICGERIPLHVRRCPYCGRELLDRNAWYYRYASNIVGAILGAAFGPFLVICWHLWYLGMPDYAHTVLLASIPAGALVGFFAWDRMCRFIEDETAA